MKFIKAFFKHPWIIITGCLIFTGFFGFFLKNLALENSMRQFFPQNDEAYTRLIDTEDTFGSMLSIGITIEADNGTILTPEYIDVIKNITDRTMELQDVQSMDSLTNIDYVCADEYGAISATQLIPDEDYDPETGKFSAGEEGVFRLKSRLNEWSDMYNRVIVNDNNTAAQLQVTLLTKSLYESDIEMAENALNQAIESGDQEAAAQAKANLEEIKNAPLNAYNAAKQELKEAKKQGNAEEIQLKQKAFDEAKQIYKASISDSVRQQNCLSAIRTIVQEETEGHNLKFKLVGEPCLSESSREFMTADLVSLIPLVVIVVLLSLYLSFKTLEGTLLPLITVLMSTAVSCGLMGFFGVTFTLVSSVIPVALIAVGSAYGIHILTHYYIELKNSGEELTKEKYQECIFKGLKEVWKAVLLAGITTAVGFISLVTSPIEPLHSFAIFTAVGVAISLILSVTFIPAVLLVKDYRKVGRKNKIEKLTAKVRAKLEYRLARRGGKSVDEASGNTLYSIFRFFCGTKVRLIITCSAICLFSVIGLKSLKIDTALINYFPKDCQFRKDIDYVDERFAGTNSIFFNIISPDAKAVAAVQTQENAVFEEDPFASDPFAEASVFEDDPFAQVQSFDDDPFASDPFAEDPFAMDFSDDALTQEVQAATNITNPEILKAVDDMNNYLLSKHEGIGKIVSFPTFIKRINQVWHVPGAQDDGSDSDSLEKLNSSLTTEEILDMLNRAYIEAGGKYATVEKMVNLLMEECNYNGTAYYEVPYNNEKYNIPTREELSGVVQGYLTLLSGSLDRFLDDESNPNIMRITCQLRVHTTDDVKAIISDAKEYAAAHFPEGYTLESTGSADMEVVMTDMIVESQISSLALSLISVFIILAISFKSAWAGIIGAIPLVFSILLNYMVMGFAGINLDLVTSIIASLAVGVGIDYTIHFLSTYKEERAKSNNIEEVTKQTFNKSGRGITTNALAVGFGFLVLCFSKFVVLRYIGVLVALVMFTSSFLAMTIIPGILTIADPKFIKPKEEKKETKAIGG